MSHRKMIFRQYFFYQQRNTIQINCTMIDTDSHPRFICLYSSPCSTSLSKRLKLTTSLLKEIILLKQALLWHEISISLHPEARTFANCSLNVAIPAIYLPPICYIFSISSQTAVSAYFPPFLLPAASDSCTPTATTPSVRPSVYTIPASGMH